MKEKAIQAFEAICMTYELPKGLTLQQEENLLWNEFAKYGLEVTREQLLEWINEKQQEIYVVETASDKRFEFSELQEENTWRLVSAQGKTLQDFIDETPVEIKVKVNGFIYEPKLLNEQSDKK